MRLAMVVYSCSDRSELKSYSTGLLRMETPQIKNEIIRAIQNLPEDATVEDAMERLYFLAKVERGLEQSESDNTISHEEIKARFKR
jgi:hypothetical protein